MSIKKIRIEKGLSQKSLASVVGVTDKAISQYECERRCPNSVMLKKIASALDCTVDELLKET